MSLVSITSVPVLAKRAGRESWSVEATARWRDPELSIGARCGSMDLLGRYKCWQIRDKSPAHRVWETVSKAIFELLEDQHEHLNARDLAFSFHMFMIGRKPASSSPTVLFSCDSKQPRQMAMEMVHKKGILNPFPGVLMADRSRIPIPLALGEEKEFNIDYPNIYLNGLTMISGTSILVSNVNGQAPRKATLGGIVCISDEFFGFTARHPFFDKGELSNFADENCEFAFYGLEGDESFSDDKSSVEITTKGSMSSNSSISRAASEGEICDKNSQTPNQHLVVINPNIIDNTAPRDEELATDADPLGTLFAASSADEDLDWALVKFTFPQMQNASSHVSKFLQSDSNQICLLRYMFSLSRRYCISTCRYEGTPTYWNYKSRFLEGRLSGVPSFSKSAGSSKFQELWTVRLDSGAFYDGDCGSWIVDADNSNLYGHIVSGHASTEVAYIVPAIHTFQDMQNRIGQPVELSTLRKREFLRGRLLEGQEYLIKQEASMETSVFQSPDVTGFLPPILGISALTASIETDINIDPRLTPSTPSLPNNSTDNESAYSIFIGNASIQALRLYQACKASPDGDLRGMITELRRLHVTLEQIKDLTKRDFTGEHNVGKEEWNQLIGLAKTIFWDLEVKIAKYKHLDTQLQQDYQGMHWGDSEVCIQLIAFVTVMSAFVSGLTGSSTSRVENLIREGLRNGIHESSTPATRSNESLGGLQTWTQVRHESEKMGINKTVTIDKQSTVVELIRHGLNQIKIEEIFIPKGDSKLSPEVSAWQSLMDTRLDQLIGELVLYHSAIDSTGASKVDASITRIQVRSSLVNVGELIKKLFRFGSGIIEAADSGNIIAVADMLASDTHINEADRWNWTALHMAAYGGHNDIVKMLIEKGADVEAQTVDDETPQYLAHINGHWDLVAIIQKALDGKAAERASYSRSFG